MFAKRIVDSESKTPALAASQTVSASDVMQKISSIETQLSELFPQIKSLEKIDDQAVAAARIHSVLVNGLSSAFQAVPVSSVTATVPIVSPELKALDRLKREFHCDAAVLELIRDKAPSYDTAEVIVKRFDDCKDMVEIYEKMKTKKDYAPLFRSYLDEKEAQLDSKELTSIVGDAAKLGNVNLVKAILRSFKLDLDGLYTCLEQSLNESTVLPLVDSCAEYDGNSGTVSYIGIRFLEKKWFTAFDNLMNKVNLTGNPSFRRNLLWNACMGSESLIDQGHYEGVKYLYSKRDFLNQFSNDEHSVIFFAACRAGDLDLVKYLVSQLGKFERIKYAVIDAADSGKLDVVKYLVNDVKINLSDLTDDRFRKDNEAVRWVKEQMRQARQSLLSYAARKFR